ncbi:MAG: anti-sigma factor [Gammaproteobacteria bacterium]|nr:anti-sigma factor [Gammaproteobacteria bacterium]
MKNISQEVRQELAARYVLGIMHGKARQRFERWLMESFELRQETWFWERELNNLPLLSEDSPPPQRVWKNIEHQLNGHSTKEKTWKRTSLFGGALAAITISTLIALLVLPQQDIRISHEMIAVIQNQTAQPLWTIKLDEQGGYLVLRPENIEKPTDKDYELWLLKSGTQPVSAGVLPVSQGEIQVRLSPSQLQQLMAGQQIAVSLEPPGGSPTGQVTGPVLYQSTFVRL